MKKILVILMAALVLGGCKKKSPEIQVQQVQEQRVQQAQEQPSQTAGPLTVWKVTSEGHVFEADENHITINDHGADGKTTAGKAFYVRGTFSIEAE